MHKTHREMKVCANKAPTYYSMYSSVVGDNKNHNTLGAEIFLSSGVGLRGKEFIGWIFGKFRQTFLTWDLKGDPTGDLRKTNPGILQLSKEHTNFCFIPFAKKAYIMF